MDGDDESLEMLLATAFELVNSLLKSWDRYPALDTAMPHVALLRAWRDSVIARMESAGAIPPQDPIR
jgi:hypothetical protein